MELTKIEFTIETFIPDIGLMKIHSTFKQVYCHKTNGKQNELSQKNNTGIYKPK